MIEIRIPLTADLQIEDFSGATITKTSSKMVNTIVEKNLSGSNDRLYITQRPGFNIREDASVYTSDSKGRGIYFWETSNNLYIVNDSSIYKATQNSTPIGTISSGTTTVLFKEIGGVLVLIDPENNQAWTITTGDVVTQITHAAFPTTLAGGGVFLDQYLFLMDDDGVIYNSDLNDPTTWNALNVISSERDSDKGVYLAKHDDQIVSLGARSIEFFYDAGNPTASPLRRRQDLFYNVGCVSADGVWELGDTIFFVGINQRGGIGVYKLQNFQLTEISSSGMNVYLTENITKNNCNVTASGFTSQKHSFYVMTMYVVPSGTDPIISEVSFTYDDTATVWAIWETALTELSSYGGIPLINWTERSAAVPRTGEGILINGDIVELVDSFSPFDSVGGSLYVFDGYVEANYVESVPRSGTSIILSSKIGKQDQETTSDKFMYSIELDGDITPTSQTAYIGWTDGADPEIMTNNRPIDLNKRGKITRCGSYYRRTFEFSYSGDEKIRETALICGVSKGRH